MAEAAKRRRPTGAAAPGGETERSDGEAHICTVGFCPICLTVTAVQPLRPEAVEHLLNAGREFLLAITAVLGARAEETRGTEPAPTLTRIDIE